MYIGDFAPAVTIDKKFTTRAFATGVPTTLAGTPVVSVYKDNSVTQSVTGVTLTVDFDGVTGLNNVRIDLSADGTFYSAGSNFDVVITTGTVGGTSVVGETIISFSINNRSLQSRIPAALTGGGNIKSDPQAINGIATTPVTTIKAVQGLATDGVVPTVTTVTGLTASNLDTTISSRASAAALATVQFDTDDIQTRLPAALVSGRMNSNAAAINNTVVQGTGVLGDEWRPV